MRRFALWVLVVSILLTLPAWAGEITGRVVGVHDGDTLTLLDADMHQTKVRLAEIDAPELGQPYGKRSKQALSGLAFDKTARMVDQGKDRYGRTVGRVYVGTVDVNAEMVRQGAAVVYKQYSHDLGMLSIEREASLAKRGLWALPETEREQPWLWRSERRHPLNQ